MIGNLGGASLAFNRDVSPYSRAGTSRVVYLINNVIYKVEVHPDDSTNDREWDNYKYLSGLTLPANIRIPKMSRYTVSGSTVIASEFVDGQPTGECVDSLAGLPCEDNGMCLSDTVGDMLSLYIRDLAWGNIIICDNIYYLVDLET